MKNSQSMVPELSRPLRVDHVPVGGIQENIVATPLERAALARRFDLLDLSRFEAHLEVDRAEGQMFCVTGTVSADVVQACVVSLEPVPDKIHEVVDVLFAPPHILKKDREGPLGDTGDSDPPEPIENGMIDLGELAVQHLAIALNPYPRKEGASLENIRSVGSEDAPSSPFAVLKRT